MAGTIQTPKPRYDRGRVISRAWTWFREARAEHKAWSDGLADHLHARRNWIASALTYHARADRITRETMNYREFIAREPDVLTFSECLRDAWASEKRSPTPAPTEFDVARFIANMSDDFAVTRRELADIDRREAATRAIANAQ